ncbi:prolyl oligopeptidase family serine peptidase [Chloroflexota bacterium]
MAGYAPQHPELTPDDLKDTDLSVCGIFSYYGPSDLLDLYQHTNQQQFVDRPPVPISVNLDQKKSLDDAGRLDILLGGHPQDVPELYQLASPPTHIHPGCPPTLLFHGSQDILVPVSGTCTLYPKLVEAGVPAIKVIFPWTNHIFDMILPHISPPAQSALYDVDRFLALLVNRD